jgi:DNA-binding MarR family transcriptional regulator
MVDDNGSLRVNTKTPVHAEAMGHNTSMPVSKPYLLHLLSARSHWMSERLYANAESHGYGDVTPAMSRLFALLGGQSLPLPDLARQLSVSRQAIHKLAVEAERLGYVEFIGSAVDARVKHLKFTSKGRAMSRSAERELILIEELLSARIGSERMQALKEALAIPWEAEE